MGTQLGVIDGVNVGNALGTDEGIFDGEALGSDDGVIDGDSLGVSEMHAPHVALQLWKTPETSQSAFPHPINFGSSVEY